MKFTNVSNNTRFFKIKKEWESVEPGKEIELPESVGETDQDLEVLNELEEFQIEEQEQETEIVEEQEEETKKLSEEELKKLKKDELNDYAAGLGFDKEIKSSMRKDEMIEAILRLQWEN